MKSIKKKSLIKYSYLKKICLSFNNASRIPIQFRSRLQNYKILCIVHKIIENALTNSPYI